MCHTMLLKRRGPQLVLMGISESWTLNQQTPKKIQTKFSPDDKKVIHTKLFVFAHCHNFFSPLERERQGEEGQRERKRES